MFVLIYKNKYTLDVVCADQPLPGTLIGTVEQIQLANFTFNPVGTDALATGIVKASWGLALRDDIDFPASVLRSLGINQAFRSLSFSRRAVVKHDRELPYLADPGDGMLVTRGRIAHIHPTHVEYAL